MVNATLPRERDLVHIVQEVWCALRPVWTGRENLVHNGIRTPDGAARSESLYRPRTYITGTRSFSGKNRRGRGVDHAHQLAPRLKSTDIPLLPLCTYMAYYRVNFTFL